MAQIPEVVSNTHKHHAAMLLRKQLLRPRHWASTFMHNLPDKKFEIKFDRQLGRANGTPCKCTASLVFFIYLFAIFILHSRESELYHYTLDSKSALAWELPFLKFMGHLSST